MEDVVNDSPFGVAWAEARALARQRAFWGALLGAALLIGIVGPFGTFEQMGLLFRLAYWLLVCVGTFWVGFLPSEAAAAFAEARRARMPAIIAVSGAAASLPVALWLALLHRVAFGAPILAEVAELLPYVMPICIAMAALFHALEARAAGPEPVAASDAPAPPWLARLPMHLGRDLILLQAQDHYLRVETSQGEALIRAALRDAEEELGAFGLRVHRSWWVARNWMRAYEYRNGSPVLILRTGQEVPVGRAFRGRVREALAARAAAPVRSDAPDR
ncbi:MAG: LytTR family DNA-binding domain-containing protein [Pseudomonadota bacterium]